MSRCARGACVAPSVAIFTLHNRRAFPHQIFRHPPRRETCRTRVVSQRSALRTCVAPSVRPRPTRHHRHPPEVRSATPPRSRPSPEPPPMTLVQSDGDNGAGKMEADATKQLCGKSLRPVRNRRYTRRNFVSGQRPPKRLFTPEIKRYLKDWLVRRRDNPYPNRDEKKFLAHETGLTYVQICNWFANWRRKLKNVYSDKNQKTWGHLIKTYNDQAQGNVEQFSICSDDSIWSEPGEPINSAADFESQTDTEMGMESPNSDSPRVSENTEPSPMSPPIIEGKCTFFNNNVYQEESREQAKNIASPLLLSKWLESAARFQPSETNYSWWADGRRRRVECKQLAFAAVSAVAPLAVIGPVSVATTGPRHGRDEVEAAVALTTLAASTFHTGPS